MILTIDASVFVSAARSVEPDHATSVAFLAKAASTPAELHCPTLALVETASALIRTTSDAVLVTAALARIAAASGIALAELTLARAKHAARLAVAHRLRDADSVYAPTAFEQGAVLVTWDKEMLARAPAVVSTMTPAAWVAAHSPS